VQHGARKSHLDSTVLCKYRHDNDGVLRTIKQKGGAVSRFMTANKCNPIMVLMEFNLILKTLFDYAW